MQQHGSKYFARRHTLDPGMGLKGQNIFFSESSHVTYQIKGNGMESTLKANILSLHTSA